jgi:tellurite resistance protein TerC
MLWVGFVLFMLAAMAVDLGWGKRYKSMTTRAALIWCAVWVAFALAFCAGLYVHPDFGPEKASEFFAGYLLEKSLSVDNLFVFVLIFAFFRTPPTLQHRALVWGIVGAMLLRAVMILAGAALVERFHFMMAFFGAFLVYSGVKLLWADEDDDVSQSKFVQFLQRKLPLTDDYVGESFTVQRDGKRLFTRLFLVVAVIEGSDVIFAVDSIPAIFGVTTDPFIVFTSNMFAILGLRALFFAIASAIQKLRYLNYGLAGVLAFIGVKMLVPFGPGLLDQVGIDSGLTADDLHMNTLTSLGIIVTVLRGGQGRGRFAGGARARGAGRRGCASGRRGSSPEPPGRRPRRGGDRRGRRSGSDRRGRRGGAVKRILVTTDFSELGDGALTPAAELASKLGAELILAHVLAGDRPPEPDQDAPYYKVAKSLFDADQEMERQALASLDERGKGLDGVEPRSVLTRGTAIAGILALAEEQGVDLIVISSQGRTGLKRILLGSVAEELARRSPRPVLIWKTPVDEDPSA